MSWMIKRLSDGHFYAGTADRKAIWTPLRENAAQFKQEVQADRRARGLKATESALFLVMQA